MIFVASAETDVGMTRANNQDSLFVKTFTFPSGNAAFAVLCDGMGGLEHGEIASSSIAAAFELWAVTELPALMEQPIEDGVIRRKWTEIINKKNAELIAYGCEQGGALGSTVTVLLLTEKRYFVLNIGDSRAYELGRGIRQLTEDHTVIAEEIRLGNMTQEQADHAPMKNVLTRCVGVRDRAIPDMFFGETAQNAVYLLCSDGFRHFLSPLEMRDMLLSCGGGSAALIAACEREMIELNKCRGETDNISVIAVFTK